MNNHFVIHKAETRGAANHGWLQAKHSFSFANYHNPERMHFGVLRVLNDDIIDGGMGFGTHPHENMEIITIPLEGDLAHKDSMGNASVIKYGDVQVMSAGTGISHSEYNSNADLKVKLLQIWVFPNQKNVVPRYAQISLNLNDRKNKLQQIVSPNSNDEGVWIYQNAWFYLSKLDKNVEINYELKNKNNGVYVFVIEGDIAINQQVLNKRDGFGIWAVEKLNIQSNSENTEFLLMELPMEI
ncbi:MAG: pirin family protein [Sphingobacteriaceae bacterium]|nr:pirin family protein [Sphingobacteriaceae bacterium]